MASLMGKVPLNPVYGPLTRVRELLLAQVAYGSGLTGSIDTDRYNRTPTVYLWYSRTTTEYLRYSR